MESLRPLYAALQELGLSENEQRLYVASLQSGPSSISALAKQLGLPRPNLYKLIQGLEEKGLSDPGVRQRYSRKFSVLAPSTIAKQLKEKRARQEKIDRSFIERLPAYLSVFQQGEAPMKMSVLTGKKDFVRVFNQMYEEAENDLLFFGSVTMLAKAVSNELIQKNVRRRVQRDMRIRALLLPSDREYLTPAQHKEQMREVRYLETVPEFITSFHLFANKVIFWQPKTPMAMLIEDEYIVKMMESVFSGLWEQGVE